MNGFQLTVRSPELTVMPVKELGSIGVFAVFIASQAWTNVTLLLLRLRPGLSTENTNNQQSGLKHLSNKFEATLSFFKVCLTFYFMNIAKTSFENFKYILIFRRIARTSLNDDNGHNSCLYWEKKTMVPVLGISMLS